MEKFKDECGIIAIFQPGHDDTAKMAYYGLNGLQHRGQESAGIAVWNESSMTYYKDNGLVNDVFDRRVISLLKGDRCLGHVNHLSDTSNFSTNAQPFVIHYPHGSLAVAFNGGITNIDAQRSRVAEHGALFTSSSTCEVILYAIAQENKGDITQAIRTVMGELVGGYALGMLHNDTVIGVRDSKGIRPLCIGEIDGGYVLASESCAIDLMDGTFLRDVAPGEIVVIDEEGLHSYPAITKEPQKSCIFEYVYFARPDSTIDGSNVFLSREKAGNILAEEYPVEADLVLGVPDSGTPAAMGYAATSGIPYSGALIKNKYVGRTYITSAEEKRARNIRIKLNPIAQVIEGKRLVLIDDSIVRGTTMRSIIKVLKEFGAKTVHIRISSPAVHSPCYYGVETPEKDKMIANEMSKEKICEMLGADSLEYISLDGLLESVDVPKEQLCTACFDGNYPTIL